MAATVNEYGWATPESFEAHREIITNLYFYQNKKLRELKVIMEQDYHFFATDKMYKSAFKRWNVKKNCKHPHTGDCSSKPSRRDREPDQDDHSAAASGYAYAY